MTIPHAHIGDMLTVEMFRELEVGLGLVPAARAGMMPGVIWERIAESAGVCKSEMTADEWNRAVDVANKRTEQA